MIKHTSTPLQDGPLVSVFCPTYNSEKFTENTLRSILEQDYQNLEVVVSDDCSTDGTLDIIKRISKEYPGKIILNVNPQNLGITRNCNVAFKLCRGKYIAQFSGDDLMYPGKISAQVAMMEANPDCSLCYHSIDVLDGDNHNQVLFTTEKGKTKYFSFFDVIKKGGVIGGCASMVRADARPSYGYCEDFPNLSDWLLHIDVAVRGRIIKIDGVYAGYIRHKDGASRKTFETLNEVRDIIQFINARYNYAPEILSVTRQGYRRYLMGELARLFISGDLERLKEVYRHYLKDMVVQKVITLILMGLVLVKFHKAQVTKNAYLALSRGLK